MTHPPSPSGRGSTGPALRLACRLAVNGVRHRLARLRGAPPRLQALSIEVTSRCLARCRMCEIWRAGPTTPDPPLAALTGLIASPALRDLRELDLTGGEPFLRDDLLDLLDAVVALRRRSLPRLRTVAITTNALLTDRVARTVEEAAPRRGSAALDLVLACGVDAAGPLHDEVRGVPGAWERVQATVAALSALRERHPRLVLGLKVTVGPWNVGRLAPLLDYAAAHALFTIVSPCIVTANRYRNVGRGADLALSAEQRETFLGFLAGRHLDWDFHRAALQGLLGGGAVAKPCTAGSNYAFVRANGDLYPCPIIPACAGNAFADPLEAVLARPAVTAFARRAGRHPACRTCTEPGLERFSLPREGFTALGLLLRRGPRAWTETVSRMGLDKFL